VRPCLIHTCHAVSLPGHEYVALKAISEGRGTARNGNAIGTAWERQHMCKLASAILRRHVGNFPAFGEWHGRGRVVAGSRQGNGMETAWYV
jgi:hypothetical protein